jgi:hypothetical protein
VKQVTFPVFTFLFSMVFAESISGHNLTDFISAVQARALLTGETPVETQFKDPSPLLMPRHSGLKKHIDTLQEELEPSIMVETLHIYEKPREAEKTTWSAVEETRLYNSVLALSTLAGLQYYSVSRGVMRTFYETSSVIDGPVTKKPLPDPVFNRPPVELTLYARQKDLTFGDNIYQYDFYSSDGVMIFVQQNLTSLTAGIIPAVGKNNLRSVVAILDAGEYLLIYAASMAKTVALPGMRERVGNSFANRAEAVLHWFKDQADKAFSL